MDAFQSAMDQTRLLEFPIGKTADSGFVKADLSQTNHLLVAGATGSGKSVFIDSMLLTLISHNDPANLRLILCDTKAAEFTQYNRIQHTLPSVCTSKETIYSILNWALCEGQKRLLAFSQKGVKSVTTFNDLAWEHFSREFPRILIVIDDLSMALSAQIELSSLIKQLLSIGRTVGIHIVGVTQTPSAKQTKNISSLFPSRIIFQSLPTDLRFVTGKKNPQPLLNPGEAWYCHMSSSALIHGFYPDTPSILDILKTSAAKDVAQKDALGATVYEQIYAKRDLPDVPTPSNSPEEAEDDDLLPDAMDVVLETGQASVSMLQRRLKLGYSRAARIVDQMEQKGYVGPFEGSKPRRILITKTKWQEIQSPRPSASVNGGNAEFCIDAEGQSAETLQTQSPAEELCSIVDEISDSRLGERCMKIPSPQVLQLPQQGRILSRLKCLFSK